MFIPTPKTPTRITFPETRMHFKHFFRTMGFKHNLSILQRIFFWNIYREMNMISSETKIAELKPKTFQIPECLGTRINMRLFPEAVESAFSWKHHSHPVVPCVTCWFFIVTTIPISIFLLSFFNFFHLPIFSLFQFYKSQHLVDHRDLPQVKTQDTSFPSFLAVKVGQLMRVIYRAIQFQQKVAFLF